MSETDIPADVSHLIFEKIDSVEQLEVLLILRTAVPASKSREQISSELRSSVSSVSSRLVGLQNAGLIQISPEDPDSYIFKPETPELEATVNRLTEIYKVRRHRIFELIFSPLKKGRHFADAFMMNKQNKKGEGNG
ncbi:MAG: hypothetical protein AABZ31_10030 [Bdellovibrionota bacterium]